MDIKKSLYNVAINGQGYLLYRGTAVRHSYPNRIMFQAKATGAYPTQYDQTYQDASSFLPWAQTDWSGGFQVEKWKDAATFKLGSNLQYTEKYGQLTLLNALSSTLKDFGTGFTFGASLEFNRDTVGMLIGISKGSGASELWKMSVADVFTQITTGWANVDAVYDMDECQGKVFIGTKVSSGKPLKSTDGNSVSDITLTGELASSTIIRMVKRIENRLYIGGYTGTAADGDALMYSDDAGSTWNAIITKTGTNRQIAQGVENVGTLYFLIVDGNRVELWWCNNTIVTQIYRWESLASPKIGKWLGKVFISGYERSKLKVFMFDGSKLVTSFEEKISGVVADSKEFVVYNNELHLYGLTFDGVYWFPSYAKSYANGAVDGGKIYPFAVFGSSTAQVPYFYGVNSSGNLLITKLNTSAYETSGKITTGTYDGGKIAVNKLWYSITLSYAALTTGQSITVDYATVDDANIAVDNDWTNIGAISPATGITQKTLFFPATAISKKLQLRITLTGDGTSTPTLYDWIVRYLPLPDYRYAWLLRLACQDKLLLLDGKTYETKRASELRNLLLLAKANNQVVEFQDTDYAETAINDTDGITATDTTITVDDTSKFPEQGRIKIDQEEIFYTGKTAVAFTGCIRGRRGTEATTHADNAVVSNAYNVIVSDISEINFLSDKPQIEEGVVSVGLLEV